MGGKCSTALRLTSELGRLSCPHSSRRQDYGAVARPRWSPNESDQILSLLATLLIRELLIGGAFARSPILCRLSLWLICHIPLVWWRGVFILVPSLMPMW